MKELVTRRFTFRLETLLRVRKLHERAAQRAVAAARSELARLERLEAAAAAAIRAQQVALRQEQSQGRLDPAGLSRGRAWIAHLRMLSAQRIPERNRLIANLAGLQQDLHVARMRTRILEELRARQAAAHRRCAQFQEQAEQDALALPRWYLQTDDAGILPISPREAP